MAKDASNLKRGSYLIITDWSEYLKKQNGDDNVAFNIKVEDNDSLHAIAKKLVDYFKTQKHSEFSSLTKEEEKLLRLNEKAIAAREE